MQDSSMWIFPHDLNKMWVDPKNMLRVAILIQFNQAFFPSPPPSLDQGVAYCWYILIMDESTYITMDKITKMNSNAPPMDNPNIKGQSTSSSSLLRLGATENNRPWSLDVNGPLALIASCTLLAETGNLVSGFLTTKLTLFVPGLIWTRMSSLVKVLKTKIAK